MIFIHINPKATLNAAGQRSHICKSLIPVPSFRSLPVRWWFEVFLFVQAEVGKLLNETDEEERYLMVCKLSMPSERARRVRNTNLLSNADTRAGTEW